MNTSRCLAILFVLVYSIGSPAQKSVQDRLPYAKNGLSERQAAEHLLNRFTFGADVSAIDHALNFGLEKWFFEQLDGKIADPELAAKLENYPAMTMTNKDIVNTYALGAQLRKKAIDEGLISEEEIGKDNKEKMKVAYKTLETKYGLHSVKKLETQTVHQKIIRAIYSKNQMHEILTDFWFNHFNVFMGKNQTSRFILSYERDAIRPNVTGSFGEMLTATAQSPAMLTYLDNFLSMSEEEPTPKDGKAKKARGLNENYAREIMELHTLGVDGGYTQDDVRNAAKILTGWTIYPMNADDKNKLAKMLNRIDEDRLVSRGFVHKGDFLFVPSRHEKGNKTVMGITYDQGGIAEGYTLLDNLSKHPSTARFICNKLATRFVSDQPDSSLVKAMTATFLKTNGNIREVLITMVYHDSFWNKKSIHQKIKSPFEYAVSAVRALHAEIVNPEPLSKWITKMGQKLYFYQAPTGFPDQGKYWINTGSLLNRINFGLDFANSKIRGMKYYPEALLGNREPESPQDAVLKYGQIILPERNIKSTVDRLIPLVNDSSFSDKVTNALEKERMNPSQEEEEQSTLTVTNFATNSKITHVVGMLIGSPEFQRK